MYPSGTLLRCGNGRLGKVALVYVNITATRPPTSLLNNHNHKTMLRRWRTLSLLLLSALLPSLASSAFENTAIVRAIELGGSLVHVSTTYAVKALEPGQTVYHVALGKDEREKTSWMEAKVKGQMLPLEIIDLGEHETRYVGFHTCAL